MKIAYISFITEDKLTGYKDKIHSQAKAFYGNGADAYLIGRESDHFFTLQIAENEKLRNKFSFQSSGTGINKYIRYISGLKLFFEYCKKELHKIKPNAVYIRRVRPINHYLLRFIDYCKSNNIIVIYEYPTYPWKGDLRINHQYPSLIIDSLLYKTLLSKVDAMTYIGKGDKQICKTIEIMNGINSYQLPEIHKPFSKDKKVIRLLSVCNYSPVHGIEKIVKGIHNYNLSQHSYEVELLLAGNPQGYKPVIKLAEELDVKSNVKLLGYCSHEKLDQAYSKADICIDSLAVEVRKEDNTVGSLKSREYISRGMPIVCSDLMDLIYFGIVDKRFMYIMKHTDSALDIEWVISNLLNNKITPEEIRDFGINNLSWTKIMKPVVDFVNSKI